MAPEKSYISLSFTGLKVAQGFFPRTVDFKRHLWEMLYFCRPHRGVEQLVARRAHNPKAVGSSPAPATRQAQVNDLGFFYFP